MAANEEAVVNGVDGSTLEGGNEAVSSDADGGQVTSRVETKRTDAFIAALPVDESDQAGETVSPLRRPIEGYDSEQLLGERTDSTSRRAFLAGTVATTVGLAGCNSQQLNSTDTAVSDATATATQAQDSVTPTPTPADQSGTTTPVDLASLPFRLQVSDAYVLSGIGTVLTGVVRTGVLRVDDPISIQPVDITSRVTLIGKGRQEIPEAQPGDNIWFAARGVRRDDIFSGVICGPEDAPPTVALRFRAAVEVLPPATDGNATSDATVVRIGDAFALRYGSLEDVCRLAVVDSVTRAGDSNPPKTNVTALEFGDRATVTLLPDVPLAIEVEAAFPGLGTFLMRDRTGRTIAYGTVVDLLSR